MRVPPLRSCERAYSSYFKVSEPTLVHLQLALPLLICLLDEVDTENIGVDVLPHFFDAVESPCHRVLDV